MEELTLPLLRCQKCGHHWSPRASKLPSVCPSCKSKFWQEGRQRKAPIRHCHRCGQIVTFPGLFVEDEQHDDNFAFCSRICLLNWAGGYPGPLGGERTLGIKEGE